MREPQSPPSLPTHPLPWVTRAEGWRDADGEGGAPRHSKGRVRLMWEGVNSARRRRAEVPPPPLGVL